MRVCSMGLTFRRVTRTAFPRAHRSKTMIPAKVKRQFNMLTKSSNLPVLKWPERAEVVAGLRQWIDRQHASHPELVRVGYFGSLNDGVRYGVGSDADVVAVVTHSSRERWYERPLDFDDPSEVPVPVDLFVYTE